MTNGTDGLEAALRAALPSARKARDRPAIAALRGALAAIDNAGAVSAPAASSTVARHERLAGTAGPLGAGEAARRELSEDGVRAIVEAEVEERLGAAREYEARDRPEAAADLRAEADVLVRLLASSRP